MGKFKYPDKRNFPVTSIEDPDRCGKATFYGPFSMDISLAKTFLSVAETGSFIEAARKLNITQSTVSARIKGLESQLGKALFERSKTGAALTAAGQQFQKHALALVRVWQHAQLEVGLADQQGDHLSVGAQLPLWDGFLLRWMVWLRQSLPDIAVSASSGSPPVLTERLLEGTLDLAIMYRPVTPPGLAMEHLFDEELVLVASGRAALRRSAGDVLHVDWGPEIQGDNGGRKHGTAAHLNLDLGSMGLDYMLANDASGYFPLRLVRGYVDRGRLSIVRRSRRYIYPVYMAYPEARDEDAYEPILEGLRRHAAKI